MTATVDTERPALALVPTLLEAPVTTLYGKPTGAGCFQCDKTAAKLEAAGVPFEKVDVTTDMQALAAIREMGYQQVPVVVTTRPGQPDEVWSGLNPAKIDALIARWNESQGAA